MAKIEFRAKPETIYNMDETVAYQRLKVPALSRAHCDMNAFRRHPKYGGYANSDLWGSLLRRMICDRKIGPYIRLDAPLPEGVTVDTTGFLHKVTIEV